MRNFERIRDIVHGVTGIPAELIANESDADGIRLDSLDMTEIIMEIEDEFDIIVEDETGIRTVRDLMDIVDRQVA